MVLARWQTTIVDEQGNILPGAQITVREEVPGAPLAMLKSDRNGSVNLGNPFQADADGFAAFHVVGGAYRIDATLGSSTRTWRYVPIGLAAEADGLTSGFRFQFNSATTNSDPGDGQFKLNNAALGSVSAIYVDDLTFEGYDAASYVSTFDDGGQSANRGVIFIEQAGSGAMLLATVTGAVASASSYKTLTVTPIASSGSFIAGAKCGLAFYRAGIDAAGDVVGPAASTALRLARFADTSGKLIADSGVTILTVGAGKQSIWVPASALTLRGGAAASAVLITNQLVSSIVAFDPNAFEDAFFSVKMPKSWNVGSVSFRAVWSHAATATNFGVTWQLAGVPLSNADLLTTAIADGTQIADIGGVTDDIFITDESGAFSFVTPAAAAEDYIIFRVARLVADAGDTMAVDARLHGIMLFYTTNANTDA